MLCWWRLEVKINNSIKNKKQGNKKLTLTTTNYLYRKIFKRHFFSHKISNNYHYSNIHITTLLWQAIKYASRYAYATLTNTQTTENEIQNNAKKKYITQKLNILIISKSKNALVASCGVSNVSLWLNISHLHFKIDTISIFNINITH
jgi:hypothetical protein